MFCPKCGTENPDSGSFCRTCGTELPGSSGSSRRSRRRKKKEHTWEGAIGSIGAGIAFVIIAFVLAFQPMGQGWWFWMLIPGFGALGSGIAQVISIRNRERSAASISPGGTERQIPGGTRDALPPERTTYAEDDFRPPYQTGDRVPPSVTEGTTRHLEHDPEGQTRKLEKDD